MKLSFVWSQFYICYHTYSYCFFYHLVLYCRSLWEDAIFSFFVTCIMKSSGAIFTDKYNFHRFWKWVKIIKKLNSFIKNVWKWKKKPKNELSFRIISLKLKYFPIYVRNSLKWSGFFLADGTMIFWLKLFPWFSIWIKLAIK